ncbi:maleylpyruvate isomerase family mycothiol-dependent enzyme [Streptomyces sp. H10-C2]|uniref:maleylpyruvate isomerase family mycothiol-dependent enzyme n=1 Tax=unclassified Streptomyces TaxID=2593676 RepID=UPI0024BB8A8B|nr:MULTISPECIES: maleylpyruvate isomerase family mycothiol-dependent enzyme [unclassified Streptomyces]MDJ0346555.1 maleylpyruvate isomerase family mycothiol-dependent enzyme [Streptomyces sp. PH10-H1]MDJ0374360.1 maleylpyruvate isomerase family mycothiol-dependent enzyme [Streptomyces sp. H10-C2]
MTENLEFSALLQLIDERSAAFRSAVAAAPSLDAPVPSCPEWTLFDLVQHLGTGQRWWAAIVAAGPAEAPPAKDAAQVPREPEALLAWYAESNELLLSALRGAGPERECWAWWGAGVSPANARGVARRRVHEVLVHTYDAQLAAGAVQPMPTDVAIDGVAEFLDTCNSTPAPWPHEAATIHYHATEGRSWLLALDGTGAWPAPLTDDAAPASASATGTAEQLLLFVWGRLTLSDLKIEGDQQVFEQLIAWEPEE